MTNKPLSKGAGTTIESMRADGYKAFFVGIGWYNVCVKFDATLIYRALIIILFNVVFPLRVYDYDSVIQCFLQSHRNFKYLTLINCIFLTY